MLSTDPDQRPTMQDAKRSLDDLAAGHPTTAAPTPAPAAKPSAEPSAEPANRTPRRRAALLALVCVLIAVATTLVVLDSTGEPTAGTATPDPTSAEPNRPEPTAGEPSAAEPETAPETARPTAPETTQPPANSAPTSPTAAVTSYYGLMPGNPDEGWTRLTPKFQQSPAGGPDGYRRYWSTISAVSATGATGQGSTVQVTVTYTFTNGRRTRELHRYQLVNQAGRWLIDTVAVLSSTDLP
jgi:eukaryotic-like serine/threonine-protein kinase